ncbi:hypothetical protein [Paracoccus cavernae]|uniref:hypothetical protein n=1 Tax=Paracoccus cavernae TaxID=1571207 RepID=UPI0035F33CF6
MMRIWLKSLTQSTLDARLRVGADLETRIIERPGCWMKEAELQALSKDLRRVAEATLPREALSYGVFAADRSRMSDSIITLVYRRKDRHPIAFNALAVMDVPLNGQIQQVVHLGLVLVNPEARSKGLSWVLYGLTCLVIFLRNQLRPFWISNVTQVPAVVGLVSEGFSGVYPAPDGPQSPRFDQLQLARAIMEEHRHVFGVGKDAGFDEPHFIITNAYTGGSDGLKKTYAEAAKHRDEKYNTFCEQSLDYDRGDDFLQLGQMDLATARKYLTGAVPRESLRHLLVSGALVGLQGLILPLVYWLDSSRQWGGLRPWK